MKTRNNVDVYVDGAVVFTGATITLQNGTLVARKNGEAAKRWTAASEIHTGRANALSFRGVPEGEGEGGSTQSVTTLSKGGCGCSKKR